MNRPSSGVYSAGSTHFSASPLRKLLRCKQTKAFLAEDGTWTQDIEKALALLDPRPPEGQHDFQPEDLEIYYSFDKVRESPYDFTLSLR